MVYLEAVGPGRAVICDGLCSSGVQVPDDVLQQGDHHDPLAAAVLIAEATRSVSRDNQLNCLVIPPDGCSQALTFLSEKLSTKLTCWLRCIVTHSQSSSACKYPSGSGASLSHSVSPHPGRHTADCQPSPSDCSGTKHISF